MDSQKTKFTVGLFVACGVGIALVAVIWLGMSRIFEKGQFYAAYFNESVQGLDIDSPVKYRGVPVGRVERIEVAPDSKLIQVVLKIETVEKLERDIVAQLKSVGITGSMFVELDRRREDEPDFSPHLSFPTEYPVVGSKPSGISQILKGIDDVLKKIKSVDLEGISDRVKLSLDDINQAIADANVKRVSTGLTNLLERADRVLAKNEDSINKSIIELRQTLENATGFFGKGSSLVGKVDDSYSYLERQLLIIAQNLEKASENLDRLT
ncbi:MAG: MCE family protein, partial [Deltaproteobacteria bacterium]|nr:MCE family protein [Deltaproteobacteria bacterium]MBW1737503.1 MCE family protein [Deltaproteobacteria bacterium]